jgi:RimJ/RimL family protein N-acetyltransferase
MPEPAQPTLKGATLSLVPCAMDDVEHVLAVFVDDPLVTRYVGWRPKRTREEARRFLKVLVDGAAARRPSWWIVRVSDRTVVGTLIAAWDGSDDEVETSYSIVREHWGRGYATEAVGLLVEHAFASPLVRRVRAYCDEENEASARVLEKAGFRLDAHVPAFARHNVSDEPRDCRRYVLDR